MFPVKSFDTITVPFCDDEPVFEVVPVLKARFYSGGFRPFMQVRAAASPIGIWCDLTKFERDPAAGGGDILQNSCSAVSLCLFPGHSRAVITAIFNADGRVAVTCRNGDSPVRLPGAAAPYIYRGEDERGWYWGARMMIGGELADAAYGRSGILPGTVIKGNFYLFAPPPAEHFGAVAPFARESVYSERNLTEIKIAGISGTDLHSYLRRQE